jgi:hypothetical protein
MSESLIELDIARDTRLASRCDRDGFGRPSMSLDADVRHALMRTRRAPGLGLAVVLMLMALAAC